MANDFYEHSGYDIPAGGRARSQQIDDIGLGIEAGFEKLPSENQLKYIERNLGTDSGAANAYVVTMTYTPPSLLDGLVVIFKASNASTGAATINVDSLGIKSIKRLDGTDPIANDINGWTHLRYDSTAGVFYLESVTPAMVTAAQTAATAAATSATNAATSETNAANSASAASTSATNAATSEGNAATSASNAAGSETNAASSASAAASSASAASTSASNAATSETNAETAWDNFDDRYLGAKASAPTLDNDGDALTTGALFFNTTTNEMGVYNGSAWEYPAAEAASSASSANTSENNAAGSATSAANNVTYSEEWANKAEDSLVSAAAGGDQVDDYSALHHANKASASATAAGTSATSAAGSASSASTSASNAATSASNAGTSETNAASSASAASTSATNASNSATAAATSESNASTSATNAATSETNAAASYDSFDDRYLGAKASAPTLDNDGDPLLTGALYWNTTNTTMYVYTGSAWNAAAFDTTNTDITVMDGTANTVLYVDSLGDVTELALGASGTVLTSNGATAAPTFEVAAGGIGEYVATGNIIASENQTVGTGKAGGNITSGTHNICLGDYAGEDITSTDGSICIGFEAGKSTTAFTQVLVGYKAGAGITSSSGNVAVGREAMALATPVSSWGLNTAIGYQALENTAGTNNVAVGAYAGDTAAGDSNCTFIGAEAKGNISSVNQTSLGYQATCTAANQITLGNASVTSLRIPGLQATASAGDVLTFDGTDIGLAPAGGGIGEFKVTDNLVISNDDTAGGSLTAGHDGIYIGSGAGNVITTGDYNIMLGLSADIGTAVDQEDNIVIGRQDGAGNTVNNSSRNILLGLNAGYGVTTGFDNISLGFNSMRFLTDGINNIAIGKNAIYGNTGANLTGDYNIGLGYQPLYTVSSGYDNVALGYQAGFTIKTGYRNIALGYKAMYGGSDLGHYDNVAIGYQALYDITSGYRNIAIGAAAAADVQKGALGDVTTGDDNIGIGRLAGQNISTGNWNLAFGDRALGQSSGLTNDYNIGVGYASLGNITTTAAGNVAVGGAAGNTITTGNYCTMVGYQADGIAGSNHNQTSVGYQATCTAANQITLGNSSVTSLRIPGLQATASAGDVLTFDGTDIGFTAAGGGGTSINYETLTANKVFSDGDEGIWYFDLNGSNYDIDLPATPSSNVEYRITVLGAYASNYSGTVFVGTDTTGILLYSGQTASFIYDTTEGWRVIGDGWSSDRTAANTWSDNEYALAVGQRSRADSYGTSVGGFAYGGNYGAALGYNTNGYTYGVAIGYAADGDTNGVAIGSQAHGDSGCVAVGSDTDSTGTNAVSIGRYSQATGNYSISIGGGASTITSANSSNERTIGIGYDSNASSDYSLAIGNTATASGVYAVSIGDGASATQASAISIGKSASSTQSGGTAIGYSTSIGAAYSTAIGYFGATSRAYEISFGCGSSDFQTGKMLLHREPTTTTPAVMYAANNTSYFTITSNSIVTFTVNVAARDTTTNECAGYRFEGCIKNIAGTTSLVGSVVKTILGEDNASFDCGVTANDTNDRLEVTVTNANNNTTEWVAGIDYVSYK